MGVRRDPLRELERVTRSVLRGHLPSRNVPVLAVRRGDTLHLAFDLPGVDPAEIDLTVRAGSVIVAAKRRPEPWEPSQTGGDPGREQGEVLLDERASTELERELTFDEALVPGSARADYRDGVLIVTVAVQGESTGHRVHVTAGEGQLVEVAEGQPGAKAGLSPAPPPPAGTAAGLLEHPTEAAHPTEDGEGPGPLAPPPPPEQQANPLPTS